MALYIGLMSGTSMDGVDAVLTRIDDTRVRVLHRSEHPIPGELARKLAHGLTTSGLGARQYWQLDAELGELFAKAALKLLHERQMETREIAAIGCHGQTLYHDPEASPPVSIQAGDPNIVVARTGITTVADFRRRDLALGGQGAPLAPAFHQAVFASPDERRCVVNIGGIANISLLPAQPHAPVSGFDSGPGNTLLDLWCQRHQQRSFDHGGAWASGGSVAPQLLEALMGDPYFQRPAPKSTGRELFNLAWLDRILTRCPELRPQDVQRTLVELTARTIAEAAIRAADGLDAVYVCGGGASNATLMQALHAALGNVALATTASLGIEPKDVEGAAFAWLAHRTLLGLPGNLTEVTGASERAPLGAIFPAGDGPG